MRVFLCLWLVLSGGAVWAQTDAKEVLAEARELARAGRHAEAIPRYQQLAAAVEAHLGGDATALIFVLRELAEQHHALNDAVAAEPLYRRVLEIGENNPLVESVMLAPSLRGLAALAADRGRLPEAESLYRQALAALEEGGVGDSPDAARTLAMLGLLSQKQGHLGKSESFYRRALEVGESSQLLAVELATILSNLGALCVVQDRAAEAEPLYRHALEMREGVLGADHPAVGFIVRELAGLTYRQGRLDEAALLYERALRIHETSDEGGLGLPEMLSQLAVVYRYQNRPESAERYFRRAAEIAEENLGQDHPAVALRLNNLAVFYSDQARYEEAEALYRRALEIGEKAFGPSHVSVAVALINLASLHHKQGRLDDAVAESGRAEAILAGQCGPAGETGELCRSALLIHRQLAERLVAPETTAGIGGGDAATGATSGDRVENDTAGATDPDRIYRAQVASRRDRRAAEQDLEELRRAHPMVADLSFRIARADLGDKGVWHRIQLGEFATGTEAQALCAELARRGHDGCFVIATSY